MFRRFTFLVTPALVFSRITIGPNSMGNQAAASSVKGPETKIAEVAS
ncbi:MAG: hypothetical protein WB471_10790 [Nocardioides sp.]